MSPEPSAFSVARRGEGDCGQLRFLDNSFSPKVMGNFLPSPMEEGREG